MAIAATAVWRARPSGNNANGGGFDPGVTSPGTDYSQQNAAQVVFNGSTVTATGSTATITVSGYTTAATDVGNMLHITGGTNFTTGWYTITAQATGTWTLDRNPTTAAASAMTGNMGGGWADFFTNTTSSGPLVPGNIVYVLGSGTPNPSSYTYDYTLSSSWTPASGNTSAGKIQFLNDPSTPGYKAPPDTTGGMPVTQLNNTSFNSAVDLVVAGLYLVANTAAGINAYNGNSGSGNGVLFGCVFDQFGNVSQFASGTALSVIGCEAFSSVANASGGAVAIALASGHGASVIGCNIHDYLNGAITATWGTFVEGNIIAKNLGAGVNINSASFDTTIGNIFNNTIDGNTGDAIKCNDQDTCGCAVVFNNIITNHTTASTFGINVGSGTTAQNNLVRMFIDYNSFYNNNSNYQNIGAGAHDTALIVTPYVASSTENYTLA